MPEHEQSRTLAVQSRTFTAPIEKVREAAHDALLSLGSEVEESDDGNVLSGRTGWTVFSFGERVSIALQPEGDSTTMSVESTSRLPFAVADLGRRNRKNVGTVLTLVAARLGV